MAASSPEREAQRAVALRGGLAGAALGVLSLVGGSLVTYDAAGILTAATGLVATVFVSLLVGIWAGAPAAESEDPPLRERWMSAALAAALAGAFATLWSLYEPLGGSLVGRVLGLLVLIAAPVYFLGMLLPVLLAWGDRLEAEPGWGALGQLVMGVVGGVAAGVVVAGLGLAPWVQPGAVLLGVAAALLIPVALPGPLPDEPDEQVLHEAESPLGTVRVTEVVFPGERQPERRLYLDEEQESGELVRSGAPTLAYVAAAEAWLAGATPPRSRYLFLGGGAYTLPRRVVERDPQAQVTVVELNAEVTRAAYRWFGVRREHNIATVHGDARAWLERTDQQWDRVYLDVYGGGEALPHALVSREGLEALRLRLRPGGVAALNVIGVAQGPHALRLWAVVRTFAGVFPSVALYTHLGADYPERQNFLLAGTTEAGHDFAPRAGLFDRLPQGEWPPLDGFPILRDLHPAPAAARDPARAPS